MKVETRKVRLSEIKPNPDNPRQISKMQLDRLVKSITEFPEMMELREIVVDETMTILGGNMRFRALKEAGEKEAIAKIATGLTPEQKREFIVKDNAGFGEWDMDALANVWSDLPLTEWGIDLPEDWMNEGGGEGLTNPDEVPEVPKVATTKPGDIWLLGKHRLLCGDSTDPEAVARLMDGQKADMCFTDPPYGMDLNTDYADIYKNSTAKVKNQNRIMGDNQEFDPSQIMGLFGYCKEQFWWGSDYYQDKLPKGGGVFVWDKVCESMDGRIGNEFELCWSKQRHKKEIIHIKWAGFLGLKKEDGKRQHPTQKPIRLCEHFINNFSKDDDIILDLFGGSGSTLIAAEQTGRTAFLMEIDPLYVDVTIQRFEQYTGEKATLEA